MKKRIVSLIGVVAVLAAALAAGAVVRGGGPEQAWETIAGPLGFEEGDEDGEREIVVKNPTTTISIGRFDASTVATTSGRKLKDVGSTRPTKAQRDTVKPEAPKVRPAAKPTATADPVTQTAVIGAAPSVTGGFVGMNKNTNGCGTPPDTTGDVGGATGQYYVQAVNCSVAIYNTATGTEYAHHTLDDFMKAALGSTSPCAKNNQGDPLVSYDVAAARWVVLDFWWDYTNTGYGGPYKFCIAVSDTDNPRGTWHGFAMDTALTSDGTTKTWMPDYPKMGFTPNGLAITANMFANAASYSGVGVYMLDRDSLFCIPSASVTCTLKSYRWKLGTGYFSLLPANVKFPVIDGAASSVGNFLLSDYGLSNAVRVWTMPLINWSSTAAVALPTPVSVSVPSFVKPSFAIPQPSTSRKLDTLGDRLMQWPQIQDSAATARILLSRTVATGSGNKTAAIRWEVLTWTKSSGTFSAGKGTTYAPSGTLHRWMPSAAVNSKGEVAMGYSRSNGSVYPDIAVAGSTNIAATTLSTDVAEVQVRAGSGSERTYSRWGDYASMSVDPAGCKFWLTTEHYAGGLNDNWQTWIQPITLTSCS